MNSAAWLAILLSVTSLGIFADPLQAVEPGERLRVLVETDIGGDADDQASLIRFLMYSPEWDVEGIIADRPAKNFNTDGARNHLGLDAKDGYELTLAYLKAYKQVYPNLIKHDPRFPTYEYLKDRTKPGFDNTDEGVDLIMQVLTADDPRPVWFSNWGSNSGTTSSMKRALAKLEKLLSREEFDAILQKIRVTRNPEKFLPWSQHVPLSVDTRNPNRWYHSFEPITARATAFDENRDIKQGHGPLGALYPGTKEGDSMAFIYLFPTGMNDPLHPTWGSWAGRYELQDRESEGIKPREGFYWANAEDTLDGKTNRENTLVRWRDHLQNDFKARMDWNVAERYEDANHPPKSPLKIWEMVRVTAAPGEAVPLNGQGWTDPDGDALTYEWIYYPEPSDNKDGIKITNANSPEAGFVMPDLEPGQTLHFILAVTDDGEPPLTRYQRAIVTPGRADR